MVKNMLQVTNEMFYIVKLSYAKSKNDNRACILDNCMNIILDSLDSQENKKRLIELYNSVIEVEGAGKNIKNIVNKKTKS